MKSIENLKLGTLIELKNAADTVVSAYSNDLTDYASMYYDPKLEGLRGEELIKYQKMVKAKNFSQKVLTKIENLLNEYYE